MKRLLYLIFILTLLTSNVYAWNLDMTNPRNTPENPSPVTGSISINNNPTVNIGINAPKYPYSVTSTLNAITDTDWHSITLESESEIIDVEFGQNGYIAYDTTANVKPISNFLGRQSFNLPYNITTLYYKFITVTGNAYIEQFERR